MGGINDEWQLRFEPSGCFLMKFFGLQVAKIDKQQTGNKIQGRKVWRGVVTPSAELLVCFILMESLNTKDKLCKMNCLSPNDTLCVFCSNEPESIEHLFFTCCYTMKIWYACLNWWSLVWCNPKNPGMFFDAWLGAPFKGFEKRMWISLTYVVFWTVWWIRNRMVFEDFKPDWNFEIQLIKVRLGH